MRIVVRKKDNAESVAWEHPRTKRIRHTDILFLRFLIILTLLATIYLGPAKYYILMQCQQESTGVLNETYVEEYRNRHEYKPNHILHLRIDDQWFQVLQSHSEKDIRDVKPRLYSIVGKEVHVRYVDDIRTEPHLIQVNYQGKDYLSSEYFEQVWKRNAISNSLHGVLVILICIVVYLFRCGYIRIYRT